MSNFNIRSELGPYKATKLWNDIVRVFRTGMPIGRHWKQFRSFDDCFVASEAVDWLLDYLQQHHEYGPDITRLQVIKLLQKFHRHRYIEDVRGEKYNSEEFQENNRLFRFVALSPLKTPQWPRQPLSSCTNLTQEDKRMKLNDIKSHMNFNDLAKETDNKITTSEKENVDNGPVVMRRFAQTKQIWKTKVLQRLSEILSTSNFSELIDSSTWKSEYVRHNMTVLHRNGYVTGIMKADLPPCWVISAMRFLSKWPDKGSESFPEYPGFEKDVFTMIKDYFDSVKQPLITYNLYPAIIKIHEMIGKLQPSPIEGDKLKDNVHTRRYPTRNRPSSQILPPQYTNVSYEHKDVDNSSETNVHELRFEGDPSDSSDNGMIVLYDTPVKKSTNSFYTMTSVKQTRSEPWRLPSYQVNNSYRTAIDHRLINQNCNVNSNNNNDMGVKSGIRRRLNQKTSSEHNVYRTKSFSDLLTLPRVETAFVGDDAYTVHHGMPRCNVASYSAAPVMKAKSVFNVNYSSEPSPVVEDRRNTRKHDMQMRRHLLRLPLVSVTTDSTVEESIPFYERYHPSPRGLNRVQSLKCNPSSSQTNLAKTPFKYATTHRKNRNNSFSVNHHSTPAVIKEVPPPSDMFDEAKEKTFKQAMQLILLFLPAANRRILHMLLKLMNKMTTNDQLVIDSVHDKRDLVLSSLWRCVIHSENDASCEDTRARSVCEFLVHHYEDIMTVPGNLKDQILKEVENAELRAIRQPLRNSLPASIQIPQSKDQHSKKEDQAFCERISSEQYKSQVPVQLQNAMTQLLNDIINDKKMSTKDKAKKLKQFQRTYPETFAAKFPNEEMVKKALSPPKKKKSLQSLFTNPMEILRKLR